MSVAATEPTSAAIVDARGRAMEPAEATQAVLVLGLTFYTILFAVLGVLAFRAY